MQTQNRTCLHTRTQKLQHAHTRAHPALGRLPIYDQTACVGRHFKQAGEWNNSFCRPEMQGPICQWCFRFHEMLLREKVYSRFQTVPELTMTASGLCSNKAWRIRLNWALWIKRKIWWKIQFKTVGKKTCTPNETVYNPNWILYWYETTIPLLL